MSWFRRKPNVETTAAALLLCLAGNRVEELNAELDEANERIKHLREACAKLQNRVNALGAENKLLKGDLDAAQAELVKKGDLK